MNKLAFTFSLLLLVSFSAIAGSVERVYKFSNISIIRSGDYQSVNFDGTLLTGLPGEPRLPYQQVKLLLPPGESAESIEIIGSDEVMLDGSFQLSPQQNVQPVSKGLTGNFIKNEAVYNAASIYPSSPKGQLMTSFLNGHSFALSTFTPMRYVPATGKLSYYTTVKVILHTCKSAEALNALANLRQTEGIVGELTRFSDNPQMLMSYQTDNSMAAGDYDILIITPAAYVLSFETLKAGYLREGLRSNVVTTGTILSSMAGLDLQEKMRNYIIQEYQQHGIQHVILGGDDELIPSRGFYCHVQSSSIYEDYNIPSDLYYSSLDGTWNTDNDDKWGEPGEDDLLPDISVGRLSFSNQTELQHMLHKSYGYQFTPVAGEFQKILMAGENLYSNPDTWGSDYLELLIGLHDDNGYTTAGIPGGFEYNKMYDENANWSGNDLIAQLNNGYPMLNHSGHANQTYVMKLSNYDITDANFSNVNGTTHNYTLVYTHGCDCGSFDYSDCIAEAMVSINNFAYAFIGNSRYGWFNEGQTEGPSAHLQREFIDALFTDKLNRLGRAHMESKIATAPWVTAPGQWEPGALRWCFYDCNVLGDPALAVWTNNAISIVSTYPGSIPVWSPGIDVNVMSGGFNVAGLSCVMMMNGAMLGKAVTNSSGNASIVFDTPVQNVGTAELVVSGYNCLPTSYAVTINGNVGTGDLNGISPSIKISPNPVADQLLINYEHPVPGTVSISLTTVDGRMLVIKNSSIEKAGNLVERWDASRLAPGTYNCTIRMNEKIINHRFIKL